MVKKQPRILESYFEKHRVLQNNRIVIESVVTKRGSIGKQTEMEQEVRSFQLFLGRKPSVLMWLVLLK